MSSDFIAVDWGTSAFRACRVNASGEVLAQWAGDGGVSSIPRDQQLDYVCRQTSSLTGSDNLPYVMCGMVGSTLGLQEVAYLDCSIEPAQLLAGLVEIEGERLRGWIVPGLRCQSPLGELDVMRGEETQLLGWERHSLPESSQRSVICMPGTHSKWVDVLGSSIKSFSTVFTGELYGALRDHSILSGGEQTFSREVFTEGVERTATGEPLSQVLFSCRTRVLGGRMQSCHTEAYLSGLLIGCEVAAQLTPDIRLVNLVGEPALTTLYENALDFHGVRSACFNGEEMAISGLHHLCSQQRENEASTGR